MLVHQEELAELIVREQGKPLADAMGEVAYAADATHSGRQLSTDDGKCYAENSFNCILCKIADPLSVG